MRLLCTRLLSFRTLHKQKRTFAVKELPWCAPKSSPNQKADLPTKTLDKNGSKSDAPVPIESFGVVAAMSENRVIGLNGSIPWPRCAQDRRNFKDLTRNRILIIGRKTYEEEPNQKHINHAKACIVVSKSLTPELLASTNSGAPNTELHVARTFPDALGLAREMAGNDFADDESSLPCWVAGGEQIYEEALQHRSAKELHLTTIHLRINIEQEKAKAQGDPISYALFPLKHRWDRFFQEASKLKGGPSDNDPDSPHFTYVVYERKEKVPRGCCDGA